MSAADSITHLDLDSAIKSNQLVATFEPYVSLRKLQARGVELHLAWQHPQYGRLAPGLFMPFIAAEGRSRQVTGFMLREAARSAADWRRAGLDWSVSLNIPIEDLADGTLPSTIGVLLDEFDLPAETFIIDVSEADLLARSAQALPAITGIRALGCGVALDSAPGHAMIQDLRGLPFTEIKVSGTAIVQFIDRTRHSGMGRVAARVYNARSNGMPVTAVGVDSEPMLWSVQRIDFDAAQGPYICGPTDPMGLVRWEKIWREAAENIRNRKVNARRPLTAEPQARRAAAPPPPEPQAEQQPAPKAVQPQPTVDMPLPQPERDEAPLPSFVEEEGLPAATYEALADEIAAEPIFADEERFDLDEFMETTAFETDAKIEDGAHKPPAFLSEEREPVDELDEIALELEAEIAEAEGERADMPEPIQLDAPPVAQAAPEPALVPVPAPAEDMPVLIARKLPGIAKPIVMTVQNQGQERFKFLKRLARKG